MNGRGKSERTERGATAIEYALMVAGMTLGLVAGVAPMAVAFDGVFDAYCDRHNVTCQ